MYEELFKSVLRAFTKQNVDAIVGTTPMFRQIDGQWIINEDEHPIFKIPQLKFMLNSLTTNFLELALKYELLDDSNSTIMQLIEQVDFDVSKLFQSLFPDLPMGIITAIAGEKYESADGEGLCAAIASEDPDFSASLKSFTSYDAHSRRNLSFESVHGHRKFLNLSRGHCLIYQRRKHGNEPVVYELVGTASREEALSQLPGIHFLSHARWGLSMPLYIDEPVGGDDEILKNDSRCITVYRDSHFCFPEFKIGSFERAALKRMLERHTSDTIALETAYTVLQRAKRQPKGALVILSDTETMNKVCSRLCQKQMAIDLRNNNPPVNLNTYPEHLDRFAAIDGSVLTDFSGRCYAIGTILDGDAPTGDIARGSRYNSALNFMNREKRRHGSPFFLALIVSEDGIADIIPSNKVK